MPSRPLRRRGAVNGPVLGLLAGLVLAIIGLVFLVQGIRAADQGYPAYALGVSVESAVPGIILLVIAGAVAIWAMVVLGGSGRPRHAYTATGAVAWTIQPTPGTKVFGNPPEMTSHRADLAAAGLEAVPMSNGEWNIRKTVR